MRTIVGAAAASDRAAAGVTLSVPMATLRTLMLTGCHQAVYGRALMIDEPGFLLLSVT
jgi:hypothetical protein